MTGEEHQARYGSALEIHRIKPHGPYTLSNCITLCKPCHLKKPKVAYDRVMRRRDGSRFVISVSGIPDERKQ
jgi:5-methylcytosine-specific restriction endonuclease McrA